MSSGGGVAIRAYDRIVSRVRRVDEVSSVISWALPGKSDHVLYWSYSIKAYKAREGAQIRCERNPQ